MQLLILISFVFALFVLVFIGLGLSNLMKRRERPGFCAHDPLDDHEPGQQGCSFCGGDADKCRQRSSRSV